MAYVSISRMSQTRIEAHTGLWIYFSGPSGSQLICTLTNAQALAILAFLGALIAFTQNRWWIITRYILIRLLHPFHLEDPEDPFSLWKLSWLKAIRSLLGQQGSPGAATMITVSPWLGIVSILNLITFVVAGALIPYYLTGSGATPIVQLRSDISTIKSFSASPAIVDEFYRTCWFNTTDVDEKCGREVTFMHTRPRLSVLRNLTCPFPGDVCMPSVPAVQIEHTDLLPVDFGINIEPYFRFSHRVTCSPIKMEAFLVPDQHYQSIENSSLLWFGVDPAPLNDTTWVRASHGRFLRTQNGPNNFSQEMSGRSALDGVTGNEDDLSGLEVYPDINRFLGQSIFDPRWKIHPRLQRLNGTSFVGIFGAGHNIYGRPVDDPLYSAHRQQLMKHNSFMGTNPSQSSNIYPTESFDIRKAYIPDHEATGLGCVEQFRFCVNKPHGTCSKWRAGDDWDGFPIRRIELSPMFPSLGFDPLVKTIQLNKSLLWYLTLREGNNKLISSWLKNWVSEIIIDSTISGYLKSWPGWRQLCLE